jgi:hypothetical protein
MDVLVDALNECCNTTDVVKKESFRIPLLQYLQYVETQPNIFREAPNNQEKTEIDDALKRPLTENIMFTFLQSYLPLLTKKKSQCVLHCILMYFASFFAGNFLRIKSKLEESKEVCERVLNQLEKHPIFFEDLKLFRACIYGHYGAILKTLGVYKLCKYYLTESYSLAGDFWPTKSFALLFLTDRYIKTENFAKARETAQKFLDEARVNRKNDPNSELIAMSLLGISYFNLGDFENSLRLQETRVQGELNKTEKSNRSIGLTKQWIGNKNFFKKFPENSEEKVTNRLEYWNYL